MGTKVTYARKRAKNLELFFSMTDNLVYCNNVNSLMEELERKHEPHEWRLFIDALKASLKAVFLFNGNTYPSVPIGHAVNMKETYDNIKFLLTCINYEQHQWRICADLKVVAIIFGLQLGYTKYCCFLCEWDSRATKQHYEVKNWLTREKLESGVKNVLSESLVQSENIILSPLHIKLGLMKNFVKAMCKEAQVSFI